MDVEYRAITDDEFDLLPHVGFIAFGSEPFPADAPFGFARAELERTRAAFIGDEIIGSGRNYSFELTVPGGAVIPAAAVSWISVLHSHRRRGVLTGMMAALDADAAAHGESVAILTASEGGIYGRFGYGVATWRMNFHVERRYGAFVNPPADTGRFRYLDRESALARFPALYARTCGFRAGMVSRPDAWWEESLFHFAPPSKACFFVVHEGADGVADGYLTYEVTGDFVAGINQKTLHVLDLVALTPEIRAQLWQFAFSVDLVETINAVNMATDEPLRFLLADPRRLRVDAVNDHLWLKIIDIGSALEARRYSTTDRLVLEIHDGPTVTCVTLDGAPDGAACRATTASPDLVLGLSQLSSMYLGAVRAEQHLAAGMIEARTAGAAARADAMLSSYPSAACATWF